MNMAEDRCFPNTTLEALPVRNGELNFIITATISVTTRHTDWDKIIIRFSGGCLINANPLKKSPFLLKMIALAAAMVCGLSVCCVFLEQMEIPSKIHINRVNLTEQSLRIDLTDNNLLKLVGFYSTEHTPPPAMKITSDGPKLLQTQLPKADYNNNRRGLEVNGLRHCWIAMMI